MGKTIEWFTKSKLMIFSLCIVVIFSIFYYINMLSSCRHEKYCSLITELVVVFSLPLVSVFVFSVITYKLKESTFNLWKKFSIWAIPFIIIIVSFLPTHASNWDYFNIAKDTVMLFFVAFYSIISLILIIYKSL